MRRDVVVEDRSPRDGEQAPDIAWSKDQKPARSREASDVAYNELIADAASAALVSYPQAFDVIVATNLFGDILSNQFAALRGGLAVAGSINFGSRAAMVQAAPGIAGRGVANPNSIMSSIAMPLDHLGTRHRRFDLARAGCALSEAVSGCFGDGPSGRTRDLGGDLDTNRFAAAVRAKREQSPALVERRTNA
jgi:3-isopropylmalate dehydrogenase